MKVQLERAGLYTLTDQDRDGIAAFEPLACAQDLFAAVGDPDRGWFQWNEVISNVPSDPARMAEVGRILQTLLAALPEDGEPTSPGASAPALTNGNAKS